MYVNPCNPKDICSGVKEALGTPGASIPRFDRFSHHSFQNSLLRFYTKALNY